MQELVFLFEDFFRTLIFINIIYQLIGRKINFKKSVLISIPVIMIYQIIKLLSVEAWLITTNIYIFLIVIGIVIFSNNSFFQVLICSVITVTLGFMVKDIFINTIVIFNNVSTIVLYNNKIAFILVEVMYIILILIIFILIKYYKLSLFKREEIFNIKILSNTTKNRLHFINRYNIVIIVIVAQMWLLTIYFQTNDSTMMNISPEIHSINKDFFALLFSFVIITLNVIVIFMVKNILKSEKENYYYKIREKEFAQIQYQDKINRQFKHDLSNHLNVLEMLSEEKKYDELSRYLTSYHQEVKGNTISVNTGLNELNILLNSKINTIQMKNITLKYKCKADIKCTNRHVINLISIIGNILDNAIEASEKSEKKMINIEIRENTFDYIFIIKNTYDNDILVVSDLLVKEGYSTKGKDRGIGLSVVKRLVKKYSGKIDIINENQIFEIRIDLPKYELIRE